MYFLDIAEAEIMVQSLWVFVSSIAEDLQKEPYNFL